MLLSACRSTCPSCCLSVCRSIGQPAHISACLAVGICVCLLSIGPSVCQSRLTLNTRKIKSETKSAAFCFLSSTFASSSFRLRRTAYHRYRSWMCPSATATIGRLFSRLATNNCRAPRPHTATRLPFPPHTPPTTALVPPPPTLIIH